LISLNGIKKDLLNFIKKENVFILNETVNVDGGNYKLLLKYGEIEKILKKINPKYLNAHYLSSYGFLSAIYKKRNKSVVLIQTVLGSDVLVAPFRSLINKKIAKFSLKEADFVTSDSYYMSDVIKKIYNSAYILTFPFGLEKLDDFIMDKDDCLIFSNRALYDNYNIDLIIKWFATLDKKYKLIISNDGEMEKLKRIAEQLNVLDRIEFKGFLNSSDQEKIYKKARYYISIPSSDATSVSLLEAMYYGCLPIVSNIPANREWVLDEVNGVFFKNELNLSEIEISKDYYKLNKMLIEKKAYFPSLIEMFVKKVNK
jgi:glycosyltransferase involved in cell wall biosynthesis